MSKRPVTVLQVLPLPLQTRHRSSRALEPSIMSQPTGYRSDLVSKMPRILDTHLTFALDADVERFVAAFGTVDHLVPVPVVELLPSRHAVQLARVRRFGVRNPSKKPSQFPLTTMNILPTGIAPH
jgi:hypothetical protein